jgi:hypothetical protein
LGLLIAPSLAGRLLLGTGLSGAAIPVARMTGSALIGLGVACWPGSPRVGMLTYSAGAALYLAWVGFAGEFAGTLLRPAVLLHVILTALLAARCSAHARALRSAGGAIAAYGLFLCLV